MAYIGFVRSTDNETGDDTDECYDYGTALGPGFDNGGGRESGTTFWSKLSISQIKRRDAGRWMQADGLHAQRPRGKRGARVTNVSLDSPPLPRSMPHHPGSPLKLPDLSVLKQPKG